MKYSCTRTPTRATRTYCILRKTVVSCRQFSVSLRSLLPWSRTYKEAEGEEEREKQSERNTGDTNEMENNNQQGNGPMAEEKMKEREDIMCNKGSGHEIRENCL